MRAIHVSVRVAPVRGAMVTMGIAPIKVIHNNNNNNIGNNNTNIIIIIIIIIVIIIKNI